MVGKHALREQPTRYDIVSGAESIDLRQDSSLL